MYHIFYVGFYCMGCVWERVWKLKRLLKTKWILREVSREAFPHSKSRVEHMTRMRRVMTTGFCEYFAGTAFSQNILFCYFDISATPCLHPHYIYPYYPHIVWSAFYKENLRHNSWELEIVILTILYIIFCGFPQLLPLHIQIVERFIAQTLTTPILSVKWGFGAAEEYWKKPIVWRMQLG